MFRGRVQCKLDSKGRLKMPSAYRSEVATSFVVTNSLYQGQKNLDVYRLADWEKLEAKMARWSDINPHAQAFRRFYMSAGQLIDPDKSSRILLPQGLRQFAGLDEELVLVGMGEKFEIWSAAVWNVIQSQMLQGFEQNQISLSQSVSAEEFSRPETKGDHAP